VDTYWNDSRDWWGTHSLTAAGRVVGVWLSPREWRAADEVIRSVLASVPATLVHAVLFGSKARGEARPDSDLDVLLVFDRLPPDREPQATIVEEIADSVSARAGVEVSPWSVSLTDLQPGMRTPMLVDALADAVPLWPPGSPIPRPPFTPPDALRCTAALLQRVEEGSAEARALARRGDGSGLARRMRDDLVRLCTASLLLVGETRPRRADAVRRLVERNRLVRRGRDARVMEWVVRSFGTDGRGEDVPVPPPPVGFAAAAETIDRLRDSVAVERLRLASVRTARQRNGNGRSVIPSESRTEQRTDDRKVVTNATLSAGLA
jgi:uncharacterized protein